MYSLLTKQQLLGRFFSNAGIYGAGIIVARFGALAMLPVYWLRLGPADFGIIGLCYAITIFISPLIALGLYDAVQRLYHEWAPAERKRKVGALWLASLVTSAVVCLLLYVFGAPIVSSLLTQLPFRPYVEITIWSVFAANLSLFPLTILRAREELKRFTVVTLGSFLSFTAMSLLLVFGLDLGVLGYLAAALINNLCWGVYFVVFMLNESEFSGRLKDLTEPTKYSLPTVPAAIVDGVNGVIDRIFLDKFVGLAAIGIYSLANQVGSALNSFNQVMKASWVPLVFRVVSDRTDGPMVLGQLSLYYVAVMAIPALAIALLTKELIGMFGDTRYNDIYPLVPIFVLIYYLQAIGTAMGRGLDLAKRTGFSTVIPAVAIAVYLFAISALAPRFGVWGVAVSFCIATLARIGTHIGLALYFYPRPIFIGRLARLFGVVGAAFFVGFTVDTGQLWLDAMVKVCIIGAAAVFIIWTSLDKEKGLALLKSLTSVPERVKRLHR